MKKIVVDAYSIISALGSGVAANFDQMLKGISGVKEHHKPAIDENPVWISLVAAEQLAINNLPAYSHYEQLLITSILDAHTDSLVNLSDPETLFVFSTTKGNISLLEIQPLTSDLVEQMQLSHSALRVTQFFNNKNKPVVISNACISGVAALLYSKRILESGQYKHVVVAGADTISKFVYSGFQSFQALSPSPCHPFSEVRNGINLGEAGATIIISAENENHSQKENIYIGQGGISNDSNHISGPSRTGRELSTVINNAISESGLTAGDIDFISAHGTATPYNDEMEARAFYLSGLQETPVNSLKGYFGHTLGAAGIVESAISMMSLKKGIALSSLGYQSPGLTPTLKIIETPLYKNMKHCLKTASGFGGCNAAIVFSKN